MAVMKTTQIKKIKVNGVDMLATSDGQVIRMKKTGRMNRIITSGSDNGIGYMEVRAGGKKAFIHRIIAEAFLPNWDSSMDVDHIDGNRANNRLENLRVITHAQNARSYCTKKAGCLSKYRGVTFVKKGGKWKAAIAPDGKMHHLGRFDSEIEAARAYDAAAESIGFDIQALNRTHHKEVV